MHVSKEERGCGVCHKPLFFGGPILAEGPANEARGNDQSGAPLRDPDYTSRVVSSASAATFTCNNCSVIFDHFETARVMCMVMAVENFA